jgi:DNA-binding beta-propeller fold protein YncE
MRKRNFKQTALAILVLVVCLFSPACDTDPESPQFLANNVLLSCFMGLTYSTVLVPYGEYNHGDPVKVGPPAFVPVDSTPPPGQPTISPIGQGATTSSASNGSTAGARRLRPSIGAAATIVRTLYMPDGFTKSILVIDGNTTLQTGKITPAGEPGDVVLSPDNSTLYAAVFPPQGSTTGSIAVISTASQTITRTISLPGAYPQWLAISPDGATLWVADNVGTYTSTGVPTNYVLAIDTATGSVKATLHVQTFDESPVGRPVASPDGLTVYVPVLPGFQTIDTTTLQTTYLVNASVTSQGSPPPHSVFSPDGRYLYAPSNSSVSIVDAATGQRAGSISLPNSAAFITDLLIIGGGSGLLVADSNSGNLYTVNLATNSVVATTPPPSGVTPGKGIFQLFQFQ